MCVYIHNDLILSLRQNVLFGLHAGRAPTAFTPARTGTVHGRQGYDVDSELLWPFKLTQPGQTRPTSLGLGPAQHPSPRLLTVTGAGPGDAMMRQAPPRPRPPTH
jgi:hypothetical protein